jgi:16S rRNA (cytosine1402-N4)-methyltransferase
MAHIPVLLHSSVDELAVQSGDVVIDGTLGSGGHSAELLRRYGSTITILGIDQDRESLDRAKTALEPLARETGGTIHFICDRFSTMQAIATAHGYVHVQRILLDLGWNTDQLASGRGFSFMQNEPLQMTYQSDAQPGSFTAYDVVNTWGEESIANVIYAYGEERYARRIARTIVEQRVLRPIATTNDLVAVITAAVPARYRTGRIHPATRTFQALRIVVNDELGELKKGLAAGFDLLSEGGRMAVITFHSLEDRIVKQFFKEKVAADLASLPHKKPLSASAEEIEQNPRARSAQLRIIQKK